MSKGCDVTKEIERLYREKGIMDHAGEAGIRESLESFDTVINAALNILSHIAAQFFQESAARERFLDDVVAGLKRMTADRVNGDNILH